MSSVIAVPLKKLPSKDMGDMATENVFKDASDNPIILYLPGAAHLTNRAFRVKFGGRVEGGTTTNFTFALQYGTSGSFGSNTDIFTSAAQAVNSQKASFHAEFVFTWDKDSDKLQGRCVDYGIDDVASATLPAVTTEIGSIDPDDDSSSRGLVVTGLHSATNAGNHAYLDWFQLGVE